MGFWFKSLHSCTFFLLPFFAWTKKSWNECPKCQTWKIENVEWKQDTQERLQQEEDARNQLFQNKKKLEQEASGLKKDIEDLELALQKVWIILQAFSSLFLKITNHQRVDRDRQGHQGPPDPQLERRDRPPGWAHQQAQQGEEAHAGSQPEDRRRPPGQRRQSQPPQQG